MRVRRLRPSPFRTYVAHVRSVLRQLQKQICIINLYMDGKATDSLNSTKILPQNLGVTEQCQVWVVSGSFSEGCSWQLH